MQFLLWPIPGRFIIAGCMLIVAGGRLGLYQYASGTTVGGDTTYGIAIIIIAVGLVVTEGVLSLKWPGRLIAALGAGLLAGMAIDFLMTTGWNNTSSMILFWLSAVLVVQAGARREC